jgi:FkbM family methyltransferase
VKNLVKYILQKMLGFERYLFVFSWYKIKTLKNDNKENHFFHFLQLMPEDASVLDIGANIGIMTVHLAQHLKKGRVYAFEPMPDNIRALRRIVAHFKVTNATIYTCALGDHDGEVEMVMPVEGKARQQGLSHVVHETITERNEGIKLRVPLQQLDHIAELRAADANIRGIKMDVENFESFVLNGARELLQQWKPVVYTELWDNENRYTCFSIMKQLGYQVKVVEGASLVDFNKDRHTHQNFIFIP